MACAARRRALSRFWSIFGDLDRHGRGRARAALMIDEAYSELRAELRRRRPDGWTAARASSWPSALRHLFEAARASRRRSASGRAALDGDAPAGSLRSASRRSRECADIAGVRRAGRAVQAGEEHHRRTFDGGADRSTARGTLVRASGERRCCRRCDARRPAIDAAVTPGATRATRMRELGRARAVRWIAFFVDVLVMADDPTCARPGSRC